MFKRAGASVEDLLPALRVVSPEARSAGDGSPTPPSRSCFSLRSRCAVRLRAASSSASPESTASKAVIRALQAECPVWKLSKSFLLGDGPGE